MKIIRSNIKYKEDIFVIMLKTLKFTLLIMNSIMYFNLQELNFKQFNNI